MELLQTLDLWIDQQFAAAERQQLVGTALRLKQDRTLLLLGLWRGFRGDELLTMLVEDVDMRPGNGMTWRLAGTKTDRGLKGTNFSVPALSRLCPVAAYEDWITSTSLSEGSVFRSIDRW